MTHSDDDPVRELIERARELRRSDSPPPELFEAALGRLAREELTRKRSGIFKLTLARVLDSVGAFVRLSPLRPSPVRLGLALILGLAVIGSWGARRQAALDPHQDVPSVALAPEPAPVHDVAGALELAHHAAPASAALRPALPAAPAPAPSVSAPSRAEAGVTRGKTSGDERKAAGSWTVRAWDERLRPRPPALRQLRDHRQCLEVTGKQRLTLGLQGGAGRRGFELVQGQRYRLILPRVSVTGPQLKLTAFVGSSEDGQEQPLLSNVVSTPGPTTLGIRFEPHRDDAQAPVGLFVDATGSSGTSELCLGAPRIEPLPEQTEAVAESYELGSEQAVDETSAAETTGKKLDRKKAKPVPPSCEPPFFTDDKGIRRLKPNCL